MKYSRNIPMVSRRAIPCGSIALDGLMQAMHATRRCGSLQRIFVANTPGTGWGEQFAPHGLRLVEFGEAGGGVDGTLAEVLAGAFDPLEAFAYGEGAAVGGDRVAERCGLRVGVGGAGGGCEGGFEAPEVAADEVGVDGVAASGVGDDSLPVLQVCGRLEG